VNSSPSKIPKSPTWQSEAIRPTHIDKDSAYTDLIVTQITDLSLSVQFVWIVQ
jgi:hypothetical protein